MRTEHAMDDPILEALTFDLESDLSLPATILQSSGVEDCDARVPSEAEKLRLTKPNPAYSSKRVLYNSLALTPCIFPGCEFITSQSLVDEWGRRRYDELTNHLKTVHQFVISEIHTIANLHRYLLHWKERFGESGSATFCSQFTPSSTTDSDVARKRETANHELPMEAMDVDAESGMSGNTSTKSVNVSTISHELEEDKQLRNKLWTERLEAVIEVSRYEREQKDLAIQCLFCKEICVGNRAVLLSHMLEDHSFHIGKADNIVFIQELMQFLTETMTSLKCMFCEKIFKDRNVLREHMRKKQHKRINPSNPDYDSYYLVNYLEPGKTWQVLDEEDPIDERREEDWLETREETTSIVCLFCSTQGIDFDVILQHMLEAHKFNFEDITKDKDFYEKVKIVNFIRRNMHQTCCLYCEMKFLEHTSLVKHIESQHHAAGTEFPPTKVWNRAEYFFPTYENDQFLILLEKDNDTEEDGLLLESTETDENVIAEDPPKVLPQSFYAINKELRKLPMSCFKTND